MRIRMICLALAGGLFGLWAAPPLAAQGCSGCTSSHSCGVSTSRGYCSWDCTASGVCACADAKCGTVIRPVTLELRETTAPAPSPAAGATRLKALLATGCDGTRQAYVMVTLPLGMGLVRLPDTARATVVSAGQGNRAARSGEEEAAPARTG